MLFGILCVAINAIAFVVVWVQGKKMGRHEAQEQSKQEIKWLKQDREMLTKRLQEEMQKNAAEMRSPPHKWDSSEPKADRIDKILTKRSADRAPEVPRSSAPTSKPPVRPAGQGPLNRTRNSGPVTSFSGGHTTHHTHLDPLGVVLGAAIMHDALASSGDGCAVASDAAGGYPSPSPVEESSSFRDTSYSAPSSYEPPCSSQSESYSSGSTDFGCSDTSSSSTDTSSW